MVSPSVGCARRTPCMAIAPSVTVDGGVERESSESAPQIDRHVDYLGMVGDARAGAGDAVADLDAIDLRSNRDDNPGRRIACRHAGIELALDLLVNPGEALVPHHLMARLT